MEITPRSAIIEKLKPVFIQYDTYFQNFVTIGQQIENGLQISSEILAEIRQRFNNLSATVELVIEGVDVFDAEIKKMRDLLKKSIENFRDSFSISEKISGDLNNITEILKKIQGSSRRLVEIIKNINFVSESIEVASRNAGITAFHAGREGRGFEVIAREMTGLVRSASLPTRVIPEISNELLKNIDELNKDLQKIQNVIIYLTEIADKFLNINNELLTFIPYLENSIRDISNSAAMQKDFYSSLRKEGERLPEYLDDIYKVIRTASITELFLGAFFQHLNNMKNLLMMAEDEHNFSSLFFTIKRILDNEPKMSDPQRLLNKTLRTIDLHVSERLILQFISEAKHLNEVITLIGEKMKSWIKTHNYASETLMRGKIFYQDVSELLNSLTGKSYKLKELVNRVYKPLQELKRITERARLLGLYAGIESARSGKYAEPLGVVTSEIKTLAIKSHEFVGGIDVVLEQLVKDINYLITFFIKTDSDVELGLDSLNISHEAIKDSSKVLDNLVALSHEMFSSTTEMVNQCGMLGEHHRNFGNEYKKINEYFSSYDTVIRTGEGLAHEIKSIINEFTKDVTVITTRRKKIVFRATEDPITFDPAMKTDTTSHQVIEQMFTGLYTFDQLNHIIPAIAHSFSVSEDGRIWDFYLKREAKFHNGLEVQAKDVVFSLNRVKKGPNANFIEYISDMVVIDPYHIRFVLKFPYIPFLANLSCGVCNIVPSDFNPDDPVGCGPYKLVSYEKKKEIVLEAFEDFYEGRPMVDECVIKIVPDDKEALEMFKRGEISILSLTTDMLSEFSQEDIYMGPVLSTQYLAINFSKVSPFVDLNVRKAMNHALDREYYCRMLLKGKAIPAHGVYPPGLPGYNTKQVGYPYDLKKARELMRQAGFGNGIPGEFVLDIRAGSETFKRAEFIKESFAKIGIHLQINPLPWNEFLNKTYSGNSLMSLRGWVSDNGDPDNFVYTLFHSKNFGASGNTSFYANPELDQMIESARSEQNLRRRLELYQKIENFIVENALWVFISHGVDCYAVQKEIRGFVVDPFGLVRFRYLFCS
ncbi:MAG: ABC transporter substrate-binding protein [candidate division WOR-3 bacterium]|nr:ABC transporter substrate-binding protein [candidate division WOR-3 bacterium]